jgi:hypothetical protein
LLICHLPLAIDEGDLVATTFVDIAIEQVGDRVVGLAAHDLFPPLRLLANGRGFVNYTAY